MFNVMILTDILCKETGQVLKGNWLLNNDLRDMLFSVSCFPSGRVGRGRPYGHGALCAFTKAKQQQGAV